MNNCFDKEAGKYKLFEYRESPNVYKLYKYCLKNPPKEGKYNLFEYMERSMSIMYMYIKCERNNCFKKKKQENISCSNTRRVPMSIMYAYIKCKRNNIFKKPQKAGK